MSAVYHKNNLEHIAMTTPFYPQNDVVKST